MKFVLNRFLLFVLCVLSINVYASNSCDQMLAYGYPTVSYPATIPLCRIAYFVQYDPATKDPIYSAEYLLNENIADTVPRINAFKADPDLVKGQRAELTDYNKAYDRGHQTPFEDTARNSAASLQSFYLSNMCPQDLHLNRGLWHTLENKTRAWAKKSSNGVYVITGPIFPVSPTTIGANKVYVPMSFYKIIIDKSTNNGIAFIIPNVAPPANAKLIDYAVTIADVEIMTKINFTPLLVSSDLLKTVMGNEFLEQLK